LEAIEEKDGAVLLRVRVQPKASRNAVSVEPDGRIRIALTAPPVDGEANQALVAFMAKQCGLPKRAVRVVSGERSREKTLALTGIAASALWSKLQTS
jgi:hypothetical protein